MTRLSVARESETVPGQVSASGLAPYGSDGGEDHAVARALEVRCHVARQLLRAEPVHQQRQVRAVLLDGAEREDHDGPRVAGQARRLTRTCARPGGSPTPQPSDRARHSAMRCLFFFSTFSASSQASSVRATSASVWARDMYIFWVFFTTPRLISSVVKVRARAPSAFWSDR